MVKFLILVTTWFRDVQTRPTLAEPTKPPDLHPISAQTNTPIGRLRVSVPKTQRWRVKWRVHFSKTGAPWPNWSYIQIWPTPARSSLDLRRSSKNSTVFGKIELRFEENWQNPSNVQRKKCRIRQENAKSGEYFQNPMNFSRFRWVFPNFDMLFFFFRFWCFLNSGNPPGLNNAHPHLKPTQPIFPAVDFGFLRPPSDAGGLSLGWVQNRSNPTCGQP